ncbi:UvrD-helicase domain-containing protein [Adlercreutzia agrestimuris]|uniref:UvrD-helicase domain-containing protein n=1 Tax=Adlercreutzia agrestimuris TaxID=2941324 RepID=UPI00203CA2B2|nr:UvrD-helicase domain-containing protein [Adlercreutzia agrestimuris]
MLHEEIACSSDRLIKIVGAGRTGKTEALIARCIRLLGEGVDPASVLVVTSTADGAQAFRDRLVQALVDAADAIDAPAANAATAATGAADATSAAAINVHSIQEVCLSLLATERAQAATGRTPRVLNTFERNFFLEDLKTLGTPTRRLRGMIRHFEQRLCDCVAADEVCDLGEEQTVYEHGQKLLKFMNAMLPEEIAFLCAHYLGSEIGAADAQAYDDVLVDDYQNLSRAQQQCICLLAKQQLIVAGNVAQTVACATNYPHPEGFANFDTLRRGVTVFELTCAYGNPDVTSFADAIIALDPQNAPLASSRQALATNNSPLTSDVKAPSSAPSGVLSIKWNTPQDEFNGLTKYLRLIKDENPDLFERDIFVIAPNKQWARALETMLIKRGFKVAKAGFDTLGGDPRTLQKAESLMAYTLLNLAANPSDGAAWRAWCGYGNYLTNSDAWDSLLTFAHEHNTDLLGALSTLSSLKAEDAEEPFLRAYVLADRFDEGQQRIADVQQRKGHALLRVVGAQENGAFAQFAAVLEGDETVDAVYALVRDAQLQPHFANDPHAIRLGSYDALVGCSARIVVAAGCVDGFIPNRNAFEVVSTDEEREAILNSQRELFVQGVEKATELLVLSTFSNAPLELAEGTKMQVVRVRSVNDERVAIVRPTCYIAEAGAQTPSTVGGQAVLGEFEQ